MDISIGGVALVCEQTGVELRPGMVYEHCQIELPGLGTVETAIEVKSAFEITDRSGKVKRRAGCVFVKPDGKTTALLQRYVTQMQRGGALRLTK
jgi:c-di-GMP-binding flagellar brake protein YcgR